MCVNRKLHWGATVWGHRSRDQRYAPGLAHNQTSQFKSSSLAFTVKGFNFKRNQKYYLYRLDLR